MRDKWENYEEAAKRGPVSLFFKVLTVVVIIFAVIGAVVYIFGWFGETGKVAQEQFGPEALLKKYEWFKDASAQLDKKQADITVFEGRMNRMKEDYGNKSRDQWARSDREQYNVWASEVAGIKANYNSLAAEYNSQMAKFNWRFANAGDLPKGAETPLPREYKPYIDE